MRDQEEKKHYKQDIICICQSRGFDPKEIREFLNLYGNMTYGYTLQMVDQFEYAVNGPVMKRLHPEMISDQWID